MLESIESFEDYNRRITYSRLYNSKQEPTKYYLPEVTNVDTQATNILRPVTEKYTPTMSEDVINQLIVEAAGSGLKFSHIKPLGGKYAVRDVIFLDTKVMVADALFENNLPEIVRDMLDYSAENKPDNVGVGIVVMNSYSASSRVRLVPMLIRMVCTNGVVSGRILLDEGEQFVITHSKNAEKNLIRAVTGVLNNIEAVIGNLRKISARELSVSELDEYLDTSAELGVPKYFIKVVKEAYAQKKTYDKMITTWALFNLMTYALERKEMPPLARVKAIDSLYSDLLGV